jgi:hypothetical protein
MRLLELNRSTNEVVPSPFLLQIEEFKKVWDRDKSKSKGEALKELAYIYFMQSLENDNPYAGLEDIDRERKIIEDVFGEKYLPDAIVKEAMRKIDELYKNTFSFKYYRTSLEAAENLRDYLENVDYEERLKSGGMVHDPKKVQSILMDTRKTLSSLKELRDAVINESYDQGKMVSDRKRNYFED